MTHVLKCYPGPFIELKRGVRVHDFRRDDRGFREGHRILYQDFDPAERRVTGDELLTSIKCITRGGQFGIPAGYVVMSLELVKVPVHVRGDLEEERRRRDAIGTTGL
jgi:hypothetical protein